MTMLHLRVTSPPECWRNMALANIICVHQEDYIELDSNYMKISNCVFLAKPSGTRRDPNQTIIIGFQFGKSIDRK